MAATRPVHRDVRDREKRANGVLAAAQPAPAAAKGDVESNLFSRPEMIRRLGTTKRVVDHAETMGLLEPAVRTPSGRKLYRPDQLDRLQLVLRLYRLGVSAARIKEWLEAPVETFPEHLASHARWLREQAERALAQAAACAAQEQEVYAQLAALRTTPSAAAPAEPSGPRRGSATR